MTTVKVNLLPPEIAQRAAQRRLLLVVAALLAVYVLLLGALYAVKLGQVAQTRAERDAAQAEVTRLSAELATLNPYRLLSQELDQRNAILAQAMAPEVSTARLLNELAIAFPATASLRTLALTLDPPVAPVEVAVAPPATGTEAAPATPETTPAPTAPVAPTAPAVAASGLIGALTFEGYSVENYAPGVRDVIVNLRTVPTVVEPEILSAGDEELGETLVTNFAGAAGIDAAAYTHRYDDGLPEVEGLR